MTGAVPGVAEASVGGSEGTGAVPGVAEANVGGSEGTGAVPGVAVASVGGSKGRSEVAGRARSVPSLLLHTLHVALHGRCCTNAGAART